MRQSSRGALFVVAAMLIFGFLGVAAKSLTLTPLVLLYAMQVMGAVSFFLVLIKTRKFSCSGFVKLILVMAFFALVNDFSFFSAVKLTGIANAVFIKFTAPIFIVVFAPLIISEAREKKSIYAIAASLTGLFLILYQANPAFDANMIGMLFALTTAISLALFLIFVKKITAGLNLYTMLFYRYLISAVALTPVVFIQIPVISGEILTQMVIFGLLFTIVGTSIHMEGVKRVKAQHAGILGYVEPLSATVYGILLLSEVPTMLTLAGGALILASTYLAVRTK